MPHTTRSKNPTEIRQILLVNPTFNQREREPRKNKEGPSTIPRSASLQQAIPGTPCPLFLRRRTQKACPPVSRHNSRPTNELGRVNVCRIFTRLPNHLIRRRNKITSQGQSCAHLYLQPSLSLRLGRRSERTKIDSHTLARQMIARGIVAGHQRKKHAKPRTKKSPNPKKKRQALGVSRSGVHLFPASPRPSIRQRYIYHPRKVHSPLNVYHLLTCRITAALNLRPYAYSTFKPAPQQVSFCFRVYNLHPPQKSEPNRQSAGKSSAGISPLTSHRPRGRSSLTPLREDCWLRQNPAVLARRWTPCR